MIETPPDQGNPFYFSDEWYEKTLTAIRNGETIPTPEGFHDPAIKSAFERYVSSMSTGDLALLDRQLIDEYNSLQEKSHAAASPWSDPETIFAAKAGTILTSLGLSGFGIRTLLQSDNAASRTLAGATLLAGLAACMHTYIKVRSKQERGPSQDEQDRMRQMNLVVNHILKLNDIVFSEFIRRPPSQEN